jgi:hypothetical protein
MLVRNRFIEKKECDVYSPIMLHEVDWKAVGEILKTVGEFIGWISAAIFFLYKVGSGYLISGLSLKLQCRRIRIASEPYVAVTAIAKKGNIGTTQLHDAMIVIRDWSTGTMIGSPTRFHNIKRWGCVDIRADTLLINPVKHSIDAPFLNLAPGDEMQFAGLAKLPDDGVYLVEAIFMGKRIVAWTRLLPGFLKGLKEYIQRRQNFFVGQWRGVCVLPPDNGRPNVPAGA